MPDSLLLDDPLLANVPVHEGYKIVGGVALYAKLGAGAMGAVYRGRHIRLDIDVAVKIMASDVHADEEEQERAIGRFRREAQIAALITHQNLVRVSDVDSFGDLNYLVMDYVDGESAGELLHRMGRLSEDVAVRIVLGAAEGIAEAHRKGIVHRDVKPDNIMIDTEGRVRVTDLGLAKAFADDSQADLTQTQTGIGTPLYMSPEQFTSAKDVGPAADVWSLGVTLYNLLIGTPPWSHSSIFALARKIEIEPLPPPQSIDPGLSDCVCDILRRATEKAPQDRYADAGDLADALREHLARIEAGEVSSIEVDDVHGAAATVELPDRPAAPEAAVLTALGKSIASSMALAADTDSGDGDVSQGKPRARSIGLAALVLVLVAAGMAAWHFGSRDIPGEDFRRGLTTEERAWLAEHPVIRLGVDPGFAPFEFLDRAGRYHGMAADYIQLLEKRVGIKAEVAKKLTWTEAHAKAVKRELDVLPCVGITEERKRHFLYSNAYLAFPRVIVTKSGSPINALEDLKGKTLGIQRNSSHHGFVVEQTDLEPVLFETFKNCLMAVSRGDIDATIGNLAVSTYTIRDMALTNVRIAGYASPELKPLAFAVRKDWPELVSILNKFLDSLSPAEQMRIKESWISVSVR